MKAFFHVYTVLFFFLNVLSTAQTDSSKTYQYFKALEALQKKDTTSVIILLKESIKVNDDAPSYFELGKLSLGRQTISELNNAKEYVDFALDKDPNNIDYLLLRAYIWEERFWTSRIFFMGRAKAMSIYESIIEIDKSNAEALYNLGRFYIEEFIEYSNAAIKIGINEADDPAMLRLKQSNRSTLLQETLNAFNNTHGNFLKSKLTHIADEYFTKAVETMNKSIELNPAKPELYTELSKLFIASGKYNKAIELLLPIIRTLQLNINIHLNIGLAYQRINDFEKASIEFQKAISLMNKQERNDFTINSVKMLLIPKLGNQVYDMTEEQLLPYLSKHWETNDPLIITNYNERLIEHYARVTYANLFFTPRRLRIDGWKTDRGEILLRYGFPKETVRYLTESEMGSTTEKLKTEVWTYEDISFSFVDTERNRNYRFAQPWNSMVPINTHEEVIDIRRNRPEVYIPTFEGPIFGISNKTYQFSSQNKSQTDLFLSFIINFNDSTTVRDKFVNGYNVGLFFLDNNFNLLFENRKSCTIDNSSQNYLINSFEMNLLPQSGNIAFEMIREKDKGVASYHGKFNLCGFSKNELDISDVVLALNVKIGEEIDGAIRRNDYYILPNPTGAFYKDAEIFLYYEIYNLKLSSNNLTDFEQKITIQKKEVEGVINSLLSVVGLDKDGNKIALTSKYQTQEKDPQIYMQLDIGEYEPGEYIITVSIKDNATGKETSTQRELNLQR